VEAVKRYIKNESTRLMMVLEKLEAKVPELKELGPVHGGLSRRHHNFYKKTT
jgi:hypothetical protein